jgi:hypothetical protein
MRVASGISFEMGNWFGALVVDRWSRATGGFPFVRLINRPARGALLGKPAVERGDDPYFVRRCR